MSTDVAFGSTDVTFSSEHITCDAGGRGVQFYERDGQFSEHHV